MYKADQKNIVLDTKKWFKAAKQNNSNLIKQFLENNFDIEIRDADEQTALHVAAANNATDVAEILLKHHANLEAQMNNKGTPLFNAAGHGHIAMTLLLLKHGANCEIKDEDEWTILHWMAYENCLELVDALCRHAPNLIRNLLPIRRWNGISPLHMVNSAEMVKKFIALGAEIEGPTNEEVYTPLLEATFNNQFEVVVCLTRHGANILQVNHCNETALDIAIRQRYSELEKFFTAVLYRKASSNRKKTQYIHNVTAALSARGHRIDIPLIKFHASLRVDLFFFTLIAYYNSGLQVNIEHTNRQNGKSHHDNRACHSAILTSLWDTENEYPAHRYNTRNTKKLPRSYRTSILNGTHFEDSLNLTVELDKSVNYFDTYYIEGNKNTLMRTTALDILNQVSKKRLDPIQGMNQFLTCIHEHFLKIKAAYYGYKDLKTSPKETRATIYSAQYEGTFFNACGFFDSRNPPQSIALKDDYIQAQLPLSKNERTQLREHPNLFSREEKNNIYKKAFLQVKEDLDLPMQYRHI